MAQDPDDMEYMTRKLIEEYEKWGLEVNIAKTEYLSVGGNQEDLILVNGQRIKNCQTYKYLGVNITNDGTLVDAIKNRNIQGRKARSM